MRLTFFGHYTRFDNAARGSVELTAAARAPCSSATTCWRGWSWRSVARLVVGNVVAIMRPPARPADEQSLDRAPLARSLLMAAIGLIGAVWALATLLTS